MTRGFRKWRSRTFSRANTFNHTRVQLAFALVDFKCAPVSSCRKIDYFKFQIGKIFGEIAWHFFFFFFFFFFSLFCWKFVLENNGQPHPIHCTRASFVTKPWTVKIAAVPSGRVSCIYPSLWLEGVEIPLMRLSRQGEGRREFRGFAWTLRPEYFRYWLNISNQLRKSMKNFVPAAMEGSVDTRFLLWNCGL